MVLGYNVALPHCLDCGKQYEPDIKAAPVDYPYCFHCNVTESVNSSRELRERQKHSKFKAPLKFNKKKDKNKIKKIIKERRLRDTWGRG